MSNLEYAVQVVTSDDGTDGNICVDRDDINKEFWTDSIIEAQKYKMEKESRYGKLASYKIISREKESKMAPVEQTNKHRHPHADMIIEWAKDTSKVVEWYDYDIRIWKVCEEPQWYHKGLYRFQPEKPERVFPTATLREDELLNIYTSVAVRGSNIEAFKCIANAAIKQYILDMEKADDK